MLRFIFSILVACAISLPVCAQEKKGNGAQQKPEVAAITTFAHLGVLVKTSDDERFNFQVSSEGKYTLTKVVASNDNADYRKKVTTEIQGALDDVDLISLKGAFKKLDIASLEEKAPAEEPESWVGIGCMVNGNVTRWKAKTDDYGKSKDRVTQFLEIVGTIVKKLLAQP